MNDTIVQEVRDARAAFAERFGYDRARIIAWAREQTKARKAANRQPKGERADAGNRRKPVVSEAESTPAGG
jgi:hypothetical protein